MNSILNSLKAYVFVFLFSSILFAQLPDPYDPGFSPNEDVVTTETAKQHLIKSLRVFKNNEIVNTIIFNNEGEIIRSDDVNYFNLFDENGVKKETICLNGIKVTGKILYTQTPEGKMKEIDEKQSTSLGKIENKTTYSYAKGLISEIKFHGVDDWSYGYNSSTKFYEYYYDEKQKLKKVDIYSQTSSSSSLLVPSSDSLIYENDRLVLFTKNKETFKPVYNEAGRVKHVNFINNDPNAILSILTVNYYEYYENGLLKSSKEVNGDSWSYEYEFLKSTRLTVEIPDAYNELTLKTLAQGRDKQVIKIKNNSAIANIYTPELEFYNIQLTPQLTIPLIVQPNDLIYLFATDADIYYAKNDNMNTYALHLEKTKHEANRLYGTEKGRAAFANYLLGEIQKYPDHPAFIYFVQYWPLGKYKQVFLDYCKKLNELYPNNYRIRSIYRKLIKSS